MDASQHWIRPVEFYDLGDPPQEVGITAERLLREGAPLLEQVAVDEHMKSGEGPPQSYCTPKAAGRRKHGNLSTVFGMVDQAADVGHFHIADAARTAISRNEPFVAHAGIKPLNPTFLPQQRNIL